MLYIENNTYHFLYQPKTQISARDSNIRPRDNIGPRADMNFGMSSVSQMQKDIFITKYVIIILIWFLTF